MDMTAQVRDGAGLPACASSFNSQPPKIALRLTHILTLLLFRLFYLSSLPPRISSATHLIRHASHPPRISSATHLIRHASHPPRISSATRHKAVTMHFKSYILALAGAFIVTTSTMRCGTAEPSEEKLQISRRLQAVEMDMKQIKDVPTNIVINTYGHCSHFTYLVTNTMLKILPRHHQPHGPAEG
jgi:hypothetical protein